ncbi:hypothetical protein DL93DRAFT_2126676 [Clavulina sp. PMI_390]|nr:hypothetical protein DL93DRAFT_2126676 [Clavulina sp. PMI_390]
MSTQAYIFINDEEKPSNIPDYETIITKCFTLLPLQSTAWNVSGVRITLPRRCEEDTSDIWVKFGLGITMGEARTQQYVARYLQAHKEPAVRAPQVYVAFTWEKYGFIVSEYVDGQMCSNSDTTLVASAVQALIRIPSPDSTPGPVGGGLIEHPFFVDRVSSIWYESVKELQDHVNGILRVTGRKGRVDFTEEINAHGLILCVSDLKPVNFMKDGGSRVVAIDFGGYSFLPPSFFGFSTRFEGPASFGYRVSTLLSYPPSDQVGPLLSAAGAIVPFGNNSIGYHQEDEGEGAGGLMVTEEVTLSVTVTIY